MGGFFGGIGQQAFKGLANQGVNNMFGGQGGPAIEYGIDMPGFDPGYDPDYNPGYQQPPQYQQPLPQQDNQQYYQQMRKSIDGMNEAFSQIEKMQMPGGQYSGGSNRGMFGGGGK